MKLYYRVARLDFLVESASDIERLLPSYRNFSIDHSSCLMFRAEVVPTGAEFAVSSRVGEFDSGGATYRVSYTDDGRYAFEILTPSSKQRAATLLADGAFSDIRIFLDDVFPAFGLNNSLMVAYAFSAAHHDALLMHSSVVVNEGRAFLFLGTSGTGKSTHSAMWLRNVPGTWLMNDDNPVLRVIDGQVVAFGSSWSGKTPCYRNVEAPVGAIVKISQSPVNTISRLDYFNSFATMTSSCSRLKWDKRISDLIFDTITKVVSLVNLYILDCRPDAEAAKICYEEVTKDIDAKAQ